MTIKTLAYIHSLLINAEHSAALKLKWHNESDYYQAIEDYKEKAITKSQYEEIKEIHNQLYEEHRKAFDALQEFEAKEW